MLVILAWLPLGTMVLVALTSQLDIEGGEWLVDAARSPISSVWTRYGIAVRILRSVVLSALCSLIGTVVGFAGAYGLTYSRARTRAQQSAFLLVSRVLPVVAFAAPLLRVFAAPFGDTPIIGLGLVYSCWCSSLAGWLLGYAMIRVVEELRGETAMLGADERQFVFSALLPRMRSTALAVLGVNAVLVWNETFLSSLFRVSTLTQVVGSLITQRGIDWPSIAAVSLAATAPPAVVALLAGSVLFDRRKYRPAQ